jgi:RES domain-containing protein
MRKRCGNIGFVAADLACPWKDLATLGTKPPSWVLTERLPASGAAGIVVPSFAKGATANDINVIFWDWAETPPHLVRVVDDHQRLPRDGRSWR